MKRLLPIWTLALTTLIASCTVEKDDIPKPCEETLEQDAKLMFYEKNPVSGECTSVLNLEQFKLSSTLYYNTCTEDGVLISNQDLPHSTGQTLISAGDTLLIIKDGVDKPHSNVSEACVGKLVFQKP